MRRGILDDSPFVRITASGAFASGHVLDAIYATVEQLDGRVPLIGFSGAPLTLFCYMVEGGSSAKGWRRCKEFIYQHQEKSLLLLQQIAAAAARYLIKQVDAGAQVLQVSMA